MTLTPQEMFRQVVTVALAGETKPMSVVSSHVDAMEIGDQAAFFGEMLGVALAYFVKLLQHVGEANGQDPMVIWQRWAVLAASLE